jgi:hypothetical protein
MSIPELNLEPAADSNEAQTVVGFSWMD